MAQETVWLLNISSAKKNSNYDGSPPHLLSFNEWLLRFQYSLKLVPSKPLLVRSQILSIRK